MAEDDYRTVFWPALDEVHGRSVDGHGAVSELSTPRE
jgi:hypothetical protein